MIKKIASFATAGAMFLGMATPMFAANCTVLTTGPLSRNVCKVEKINKAKLNLNNTSNVATSQTDTSNSGGNSQTLITTSLGTGIDTGKAKSENTNGVDVNTTDVTVHQGGWFHGNGLINTAGPLSTNKTSFESENKAYVSISNNAAVITSQNGTANSGNNSQSLITVNNGGITTGPAISTNDNTVFANHTTINIGQ